MFVLGTFLMRSAGCCVNDVADRDFDRHVKRTAARPVTSGEVGVGEALALGAVLALAAFALVLTTNAATVAWSVVALAVTLFYPVSKRFFAMPQAVLGIAFSFGIPMAFAAVRGAGASGFAAFAGAVPSLAWWLLFGNLFWVLAYDTEYAMVDRDDDLRIGIKTSAITLGRFDVAAVMASTPSSWPSGRARCAHRCALALLRAVSSAAALMAAWHYTLIRDRSRDGCFRAFRLNHWLGFAVFVGIVVDFALR